MIKYERVMREVQEVAEVTCDECGAELEPAISSHGFGGFPQARDALVVEAHGGYGMYVDVASGNPRVVWCRDCVVRIRGLVPSLDKALSLSDSEFDD